VTDRQIACYVENYSSGDAFGEFTFGASSATAFEKIDNGSPVATVAMVFRPLVSGNNRMLFMAYDAAGNLADNAPLDRHGVLFAADFDGKEVPPSIAELGTPGTNFNNHIPSNCLSCHGGNYVGGTSHVVSAGAVFLPWDLEQFEFRPGGRTSSEEVSFRDLNQLARKVAVSVGRTAVSDQVDRWYGNSAHSAVLPSSSFDPDVLPDGWNSNAEIYSGVVRPSCRGCHIAAVGNPELEFESASDFLGKADAIAKALVDDDASIRMPHALQTMREFWLSSQPVKLEAFFRAAGKTSAANKLASGGHGNVITLDPYAIAATTF
jgi:hypothetical protein